MNENELAEIGQQQGLSTLFGTSDPVVVVERARKVANALTSVIEAQKMYAIINRRKHLTIEAWTTLGSMLGVFPYVEWSKPVEGGWEARALVKLRDGSEIGAAEAQCKIEEANWRDRDDYAVRSMAQTRACSKALALVLRFIPALAGYSGTPAEEMPHDQAAEHEVREPVKQPERKAKPGSGGAAKSDKPSGAAPGGTWTGAVQKITYRDGEKDNGEKYKLYTIYGEGNETFTTFSDTIAGDARMAKDQGLKVVIGYSVNQYGKKCETLRPEGA